MEEILKLFNDFTEAWEKNPNRIVVIDGKRRIKKPLFSDFLEWLRERKNNNLDYFNRK